MIHLLFANVFKTYDLLALKFDILTLLVLATTIDALQHFETG